MKSSLIDRYIKKFKRLTIKDDFMFCKVMQKPHICFAVLNIVLKHHPAIAPIKLITPQATIENHSELKSVRLDVLVEDENDNHCDIEMQVVGRKGIKKRMRIYQASIDVSKIRKGEDYDKIGNTIIIFFCMFDPIGKGLPMYSFENYCTENKDIKMNDGTYKIIININAWEKVSDPDLKALLKYMSDGIATNEITKEIDMATLEIKKDGIITQEYVSMYAKYCDIKRHSEIRGIRKGKAEERLAIARNMKENNFDIESIIKATKLSKEEIEKL